ncbi:MAG: hypothetical protein VB021_09650 [Oscillospiraceae bacterium]|nr:hypothetical protein [Oscillospiraceae bacterium]
MKNKRLLFALLLAAVACGLAAAGWTLLPDTLVMQITLSGAAGTTLPKLPGLALPALLSVVFSFLYAKSGSGKHLTVALVGIAALVLTFVMNS